ncbi:hypothetical protein QEG73_14905 [Chitinophagaceae bacterium 26-R-25]|nr:hypothetical protein [Chitinophagaceae bacterium 26-R-25]
MKRLIACFLFFFSFWSINAQDRLGYTIDQIIEEFPDKLFETSILKDGTKYMQWKGDKMNCYYTFGKKGYCDQVFIKPVDNAMLTQLKKFYSHNYAVINDSTWEKRLTDDIVTIGLVTGDDGDFFYFISQKYPIESKEKTFSKQKDPSASATFKDNNYYNKEFKFHVKFPVGWTTSMGIAENQLVIASDPSSSRQISIRAVKIPGITLSNMYELVMNKDNLEASFNSADIKIKKTRNGKLGGVESKILTLDQKITLSGETFKMHSEVIMCVKDGTFFMITFEIPEESYGPVDVLHFNALMNNFKFDDK